MNKDPILEMTAGEIQDACEEILKNGHWTHHSLVGLIIGQLKEWGCHFKWVGCWRIAACDGDDYETYPSLQVAFLRTAQALGHWSPPKKVEEPFNYWRNKISGSIVEMRPEFIGSMATHPEEWQRVTVTPYVDNLYRGNL